LAARGWRAWCAGVLTFAGDFLHADKPVRMVIDFDRAGD
jgi:hypothetical protein